MQRALPVILARHPARSGDLLQPMLGDWLSIEVVGSAESEAQATALADSLGRGWNLLLVDLLLKSGTGLGVVKSVRKHHDQFVLVLASRVTRRMRARCLSLGADAVFDETTELNALLRFCASASLMMNSAAIPRDENFRRSLLDAVRPDHAAETFASNPHPGGARRWRRAGRALPWPKTTRFDTHLANVHAGRQRVGGACDPQRRHPATAVSFAEAEVEAEAGGLAALLAWHRRDIAHSGEAADLIVATIASVCSALDRSMGRVCIGAMVRRSLRLAALRQPWMRSFQDNGASTPDLAALKSLLAAQEVQATRKAGNAILGAFGELLSAMVGPSLGEELLRDLSAPFAKRAGTRALC